jgi:hypothetical protein
VNYGKPEETEKIYDYNSRVGAGRYAAIGPKVVR